MEAEAELCVGTMSKRDLLRGIITEKLSAAAREILAVVERTVAGYEEEASGFRLEMERQRRQLEVLLQPRVPLHRTGVKRGRILADEDDEEKPEDLNHVLTLSGQGEESLTPVTGQGEEPLTPVTGQGEEPLTPVSGQGEEPLTAVSGPSSDGHKVKVRICCVEDEDQTGNNDAPPHSTAASRGRGFRSRKLRGNRSSVRGGATSLVVRPETETEEEEIHLQKDNNSGEPSSVAAMLARDDVTPQTSAPVQDANIVLSPRDLRTNDDEDDGDEDEEFLPAAQSEDDSGDDDNETSDSDGWKADEVVAAAKDEDEETKTVKKRKWKRSRRLCGALLQSDASFLKHACDRKTGSVCGVCGERPESDETSKPHPQSPRERVAAPSGQTPHRCDACDAAFASKMSLEDHQKRHQGAELHKCGVCQEEFELREELKVHRRSHAKQRTHLCGVCGKVLSDHRSLSRHKMTHSAERPHSCQVCGRSFKLIGTLRQHRKVHADRERSFLCDVCCKMFVSALDLQLHLRTHSEERPFGCAHCHKRFGTKGALTVHTRVHTGEAPYRCPHCGSAFKRKNNLSEHMTVHSGVRAFLCGVCGKACARKAHLTVHMRTHNGERPYKCTLCDKAFTQSHCVKKHMRSHRVVETQNCSNNNNKELL